MSLISFSEEGNDSVSETYSLVYFRILGDWRGKNLFNPER
jgi:hypothetical protein